MTHEPQAILAPNTDVGESGGLVSPLGVRLREIRRLFIAEGGRLLTPEEIETVIAEGRGGLVCRREALSGGRVP